MKVKAIFKGENSLGYFEGETYTLNFLIISKKITIIRITGDCKGFCLYDSLRAFLDNWEVL